MTPRKPITTLLLILLLVQSIVVSADVHAVFQTSDVHHSLHSLAMEADFNMDNNITDDNDRISYSNSYSGKQYHTNDIDNVVDNCGHNCYLHGGLHSIIADYSLSCLKSVSFKFSLEIPTHRSFKPKLNLRPPITTGTS